MRQLAINGAKPLREKKIFYGHQYIDEQDIQAVVRVLRSDYLTCGPQILALEHKLCSMTGAKYAVAVSNGTAALHIACLAAGIQNGDEVITTPLTFAASANCVFYCGARPVFADIRKDTYNISPEEILKKVTPNTKAVIAVDFTGQSVEIDSIREICDRHHLILIEDAAHALGTCYRGIPTGKNADLTTFSFHPVKTVTGGEGGAVLTDDKDLYEKLLLFRSHGITRERKFMDRDYGSWYYEQLMLGYNYRMTDIQAALIISQLDKLYLFSHRRQNIVRQYDTAFQNIPEIILQKEIPESDTVRHLYLIQLRLEVIKVGRREIVEALAAENIYCNVHYIPVYWFPYYRKRGYCKGICPNAEKLYERIFTIPLFYSMSDGDVNDVITAVKEVIEYYRLERESL